MKRKLFFFVILLCCCPIIGLNAASNRIKTIVIDAGHGGKDPGAMGKNSKEKHIALSIALKTGAYIEQNFPDVKVIYTRKTDVFIPLHKRAKIANDAKADLFMSIHCNANNSSRIYGAETYVMGLHKNQANLEVAKKENASILKEEDYMQHYEGFNPNSPEAYIIFSLYQHANLDQSLSFAAKVQQQFKERVGLRDRGVIQAGFLVLFQTTMPGVLIETSYLSNSNDEKYLISKKGQTYIASAIYRAFKEYKAEYEKNVQVLTTTPTQTVKKEKNIVFRVQVASSSRDLKNHKKFKDLGPIFVYKHNGLNKYCVGNEKGISSANWLKNNLRKRKFKDAFVVSFLNGKRIPVNQAQELLKK